MRACRALGVALGAVAIASGALGSACALAFPVRLIDGDASSDDAGPEAGGPGAGADAAGSDARPSPEAGSWCAQFPADAAGFCDDFDTKAIVTDLWTFVDPTDTSAAFSTAHVVSAPYSADLALLTSAGPCTQSHLQRTVPPGSPAAKVHAEAAFYADDSTATKTALTKAAIYALSLAGGACGLNLALDPTNAFVWEVENGGMTNAFHDLHVGTPEGSWHEVAFDLDRSASPPTLTVTLDTNVLAPFTVDPACAGAGDVSMLLGYMCVTPPAATVHVYYDDVRTLLQ